MRDLVLNGLDVRPLAVKLISPEAAQVAHIHQFDAEREAILAQGELARQHRLHVELPSHFLEVEVLPAPFIMGYRAERLHLEATYFVEAFDDAFRDPVAEVLSLGVAADVLERQHGDRMNALIACGAFVNQVQPLEHLIEARVAPQALPLGIDLEEYDPGISVIASLVQPVKGLIFVSEARVDGGHTGGQVRPIDRQLLQLLQNPLGFQAIAGDSIGIAEQPQNERVTFRERERFLKRRHGQSLSNWSSSVLAQLSMGRAQDRLADQLSRRDLHRFAGLAEGILVPFIPQIGPGQRPVDHDRTGIILYALLNLGNGILYFSRRG